MVKELIVSLGIDLELTAEEIADIFWLTKIRQQYRNTNNNLPENEPANQNETTRIENNSEKATPGKLSPSDITESRDSSDGETPSSPQSTANQNIPSQLISESPQELGLFTQNSTIDFDRSFPIRVSNASIDQPLRFMRSLRPLIKPIAVRESFSLDEAATVKKIVEERIFLPVLKPILEPWLDLALVIDESPSMKIWQQTINEIPQLLGRYGIFGDVRTYGIVQDERQIYLRPGIGKEINKQTIVKPSSLIEPGARRLILILTDCVSPFWYSNSILPMLRIWAATCPMALVQVLPEWLWERTALGDKTLVQLFGLAPGIPNQKLSIVPDPFRDLGKTKFDDYEDNIADKITKEGDNKTKKQKKIKKLELKVPILSLEPKFASVWSRMISGQGGVKTPGFIFEYDLEIDSPEKPTESVNLNRYELTPEERVDRFWNASSNLAWRLAGLLAASPEINLPVTRLIQQNFLPSSQQSHVAEVLLGGLVEPKNPIFPSSPPDSISYQFVDEQVRSLLLDNAPATDTVSVLSSYITRRWGRTLDQFTAQLQTLLESSDDASEQKALPFAIVSTEVLRRREGKYKEIVRNLDRIINQETKNEISSALKTFTFEVATIAIKLEFKIVTLVPKEQINNRPKPEDIYFTDKKFSGSSSNQRRYQSYKELSENEIEGEDYIIRYHQGISGVAILAPHGGYVETGTTEIAEAIANGDHSFYTLEALKEPENYNLSIASHKFDEPHALQIVAKAERVIIVHGMSVPGSALYLGGLDQDLKHKIIQCLQKQISLFNEYEIPFTIYDNDSNFKGVNPQNICNRSKTGQGVQIGISWNLRKKLFGSLKSNNDNELTLFDRFIQAIRDALSPLEAAGWRYQITQGEADYYTEDLGDGVELDMISIPGGSFMMGSQAEETDSYDDERPQHQVTVPSFYMGRYPITQAQWQIVASWEQVEKELDSDPSEFNKDYEGIDRWTRPVEQISWEDAKEFCARLSRKTGKEYRLPTEAEWEYACRAGTTTPFHFGETISTELANYNGSVYGEGVEGVYREQTTPVGYFKVANNFGLSDMHGNVWEWCEDDWHENYENENAPNDGSAWLSEDSNFKVIRGGSWFDDPYFCRSADRVGYTRALRNFDLGFRVVCVAGKAT